LRSPSIFHNTSSNRRSATVSPPFVGAKTTVRREGVNSPTCEWPVTVMATRAVVASASIAMVRGAKKSRKWLSIDPWWAMPTHSGTTW